MAILAAGIANHGGVDPKASRHPGGNGDAHGDEGRKEVDDEQQLGVVDGRKRRRVDAAELQAERWAEESDELLPVVWPDAAEAKGLQERGEKNGGQSPQGEGKGEQACEAREVELRVGLARAARLTTTSEKVIPDVPRSERPCPLRAAHLRLCQTERAGRRRRIDGGRRGGHDLMADRSASPDPGPEPGRTWVHGPRPRRERPFRKR